MCDVATQRLIEQVVTEKVQAGEMFTALDVTREVQRRGSKERHQDMKHIVHQWFEQGAGGHPYKRVLVRIPGAPIDAWLYFPHGANPRDFPPLKRQAPATTGKGKTKTGGRQVDRRSRLCVPVRWLRAVGLKPGDAVFVIRDGKAKGLVLAKASPKKDASAVLRTYRIEKNGNVRIAQKTLQLAGLGGQAYDIDGDKSRVLLRLHGPQKGSN